jgi:hypothetical protein
MNVKELPANGLNQLLVYLSAKLCQIRKKVGFPTIVVVTFSNKLRKIGKHLMRNSQVRNKEPMLRLF